jgi:hypothetical protein
MGIAHIFRQSKRHLVMKWILQYFKRSMGRHLNSIGIVRRSVWEFGETWCAATPIQIISLQATLNDRI